MLELKEKEKLTFVYQTVYNTDPVKFFDIAGKDGSVSAKSEIFFSLFVRVSVWLSETKAVENYWHKIWATSGS